MKWAYKKQINPSHELVNTYGKYIGQLLYARGIESITNAKEYIEADVAQIPVADLLPNIKKAVRLIKKCVQLKQKIVIYGDYDVDGICATAILFDYLYRELHADVMPYIPNRFAEGYGLNEQALEELFERGTNLIITVDCGIRDEELVNQYYKKGLKFVITDHHEKPKAKLIFNSKIPIIHPGLGDSKYPNLNICGTNVAWKLVQALSKTKAIKYLDLVALATVCDVMPLVGENRIIVKAGLNQLKQTENIGIRELLNLNRIEPEKIDVYHLGFILGPRLNAAGRMEDALLGLKLLTSKDFDSVSLLAQRLESLNKERQNITLFYLSEAEKQALTQVNANEKLLFIVGENWSEGVVGLVAGKLCEKYNLPVIVATNLNTQIKGSARSIKGFDITESIANHAQLLTKFGGHPQAAGFSLDQSNLAKFRESIQSQARLQLDEAILEKTLEIDMPILDRDLNLDLIDQILNFKPFGYGNGSPIFSLMSVEIINHKLLGNPATHLKFTAKTKSGKYLEAIAFNKAELFATIEQQKFFDLAFNLELNIWNGQSNLQLNLKDLRPTS